jgi:uncharacterized C2H2 Zn-finger protein
MTNPNRYIDHLNKSDNWIDKSGKEWPFLYKPLEKRLDRKDKDWTEKMKNAGA